MFLKTESFEHNGVTVTYETTITQSAWRRLFWPVL